MITTPSLAKKQSLWKSKKLSLIFLLLGISLSTLGFIFIFYALLLLLMATIIYINYKNAWLSKKLSLILLILSLSLCVSGFVPFWGLMPSLFGLSLFPLTLVICILQKNIWKGFLSLIAPPLFMQIFAMQHILDINYSSSKTPFDLFFFALLIFPLALIIWIWRKNE